MPYKLELNSLMFCNIISQTHRGHSNKMVSLTIVWGYILSCWDCSIPGGKLVLPRTFPQTAVCCWSANMWEANTMSKLCTNTVAAFIEASAVSGKALINLVYWSVQTIANWLPDFISGIRPSMSIATDSSGLAAGNTLNFFWGRLLVPCTGHKWQSALDLYASLPICCEKNLCYSVS